jgi:hypothetical protein
MQKELTMQNKFNFLITKGKFLKSEWESVHTAFSHVQSLSVVLWKALIHWGNS